MKILKFGCNFIFTLFILVGCSTPKNNKVFTEENIAKNPSFSEWRDGAGKYSTPEGFTTGKNKAENGIHDVASVIMPTNAPSIVSDYASSYTALGKKRPEALRPHSGIDITAPKGYPVISTADGAVIISTTYPSGGNTIVIEHGFVDDKKLLSAYLHLTNILVPQGSLVKRGQVIGTVGRTGKAWGGHVHLHFGVDLLPTDLPDKAFYKHHVNPHNYWIKGPGKATCFDDSAAYDNNMLFTYLVPCVGG